MSENMTMAELLAAEENHKPKRGEIVKATVEYIRENQVVLAVPGYAGRGAGINSISSPQRWKSC